MHVFFVILNFAVSAITFQGCVVGGILGLAFPLWISIGAYGLPSEGYSLAFPTHNCTASNVTMATTLAPVTTTVLEQ